MSISVYPAERPNRTVIASNTLRASADTERSTGIAGDFILLKEIMFVFPSVVGRVRVSFEMRSNISGQSVDADIRVNGISFAVTATTSSGAYEAFTRDVSYLPFGALQLWTRVNHAGNMVFVRNFRVFYDFSDLPVVIVD